MDDNNCKELMDQTVMDISTDQSTTIKQLKSRPPVDQPVYKSLEAFLFENFSKGLEIDYKPMIEIPFNVIGAISKVH